MLSTRLPATMTIVLLLVVAARAQQPAGTPSAASAINSAIERTSGTMIGAVLRGGDPVSRAPVRLRDVASGRILFQSIATERGEFTFTAVPPGSYVSEFLDGDDRVLAYGEVFGILPGQTVVSVIDASNKRRPPRRSKGIESGTNRRSGRFGGKLWMAAAAVASGALIVGKMSSDR